MELIDKSALVTEIERLKECNWKICAGNFEFLKEHYPECYYSTEAYNDILSFLDTLEVKEVDLEKEIQSSMNNLCELGCYAQSLLDNPEAYEFAKPFPKEVDDEIANFAKHFFELGLKTQKGE